MPQEPTGIGCFPRRRSSKVLSHVAEEKSYGTVSPETCLLGQVHRCRSLSRGSLSLLSSEWFPKQAMRLSRSFKEQQPIDLSHPIGNRDLRCYFGTIAYRALSTAQLSSIKTVSLVNADDNARWIHVREKYLSNSKVVVHERRNTLIKMSPRSEKRCAWEWKHAGNRRRGSVCPMDSSCRCSRELAATVDRLKSTEINRTDTDVSRVPLLLTTTTEQQIARH